MLRVQTWGVRDEATNEEAVAKTFPFNTKDNYHSFCVEVEALRRVSTQPNTHLFTQVKNMSSNPKQGTIIFDKYPSDLFAFAFERPERPKEKVIRRLFKQICEGVSILHHLGIAHLDLKPENILLDNEQNVRICDFGSCYLSSKEVPLGQINMIQGLGVRGSPHYCPPEVNLCPQNYDPFRVDVYSLGITLFALTTGCFPETHHSSAPALYYLAAQKFSPPLLSLLQQMLQPNPALRPTVDQILSDPFFRVSPTVKFPSVLRRRIR